MKPETVQLGQCWCVDGMQGRPYWVIDIVALPGCSTNTVGTIVPWAIFRKGNRQPCVDLLTGSRWHYLPEKDSPQW